MNKEETFEAICINKGDTKYLTDDKPYLVSPSKEYENYYDVVNDIGNIDSYRKERFRIVEGEKVEDKTKLSHSTIYAEEELRNAKKNEVKTKKVLMLECIDNEEYPDRLTLGKRYSIIEDEEDYYVVKDDKGEEENYYKSRFKIVEHPKIINYEEEYKKLKEENERLHERIDKYQDSILKKIEKNEELTAENKQLTEDIQQSNFKLKEYESKLPQLKELVVKLIRINEILASNIYVEGLEE